MKLVILGAGAGGAAIFNTDNPLADAFTIGNSGSGANIGTFNVRGDGTTTLVSEASNSSSPLSIWQHTTKLFEIGSNGGLLAPHLPTGTSSGTFYNLLIDATGEIIKSTSPTASAGAWSLGGNTSAGAALGTTDGTDLPFITGTGTGTERMRITATGNIAVANNNQILLNGTDPNHGLGAFGAGLSNTLFASKSINGPVLYGFDGGALGSTQGGQKIALRWNSSGQIFIGPRKPLNFPNAALSVDGALIVSQDIWVADQSTGAWADYVFSSDYKLKSLTEIEKYIQQNKHLPNVPSAAEIKEKGQNLGKLQVTQMEKIEELTLYMIELNKKVEALQKENQELKKSLNK